MFLPTPPRMKDVVPGDLFEANALEKGLPIMSKEFPPITQTSN